MNLVGAILAGARQRPMQIVLLASLIQFSRIFMGLTENHTFRQSQTVSVVRSFMRFGFDPKTPQNIFGGSFTPIPFEFPIFQYFSALVGNLVDLDPIYATRFMNLVLFQLSAILVVTLLKQLGLAKYQLVFIVIYEFSPFGFNFGHAALIEFLPVCLLLFALLQYILFLQTSNKFMKLSHVSLFFVILILSFLSKFTTAFALIPLFFLVRKFLSKGDYRKLAPLLFGLASALACSYIWVQYSDNVKSGNQFTKFLTSSALKHWNYGDISQRLSPFTWDVVFNQYYSSISGGLGVAIAIVLIFLLKSRGSLLFLPICGSIVLGPLVFTNLYFSHDYYLCAIYVPSVLMIAIAVVESAENLNSFFKPYQVKFLLVIFILLNSISSKYGHAYVAHSFFLPHEPPRLVKMLSSYDTNVNIVLIDCDWDPTIGYYLDRSVLMIPNWPVQNLKEIIPRTGIIASCQYPNDSNVQEIYKLFNGQVDLEKIENSIYSFSKTLAAGDK